MRKLYLLFVTLASFSVLQAQTLLNEGFEGTTFPPAGWTLLKGNAANSWRSDVDPTLLLGPYAPHTGLGAMVYEFDTTTAADAWAITPGVRLNAGVSYSISFYYRVASASFPERLKVTVGNFPSIVDQTTTLWNNGGASELTNTRWQIGVIQYTPASSGNFYFGFNCYSAPDQYALVIDDVRVEVAPTSAPPCTTNLTPANNSNNVNNPITFSWNAAPGATSYDFYIGTANPPTTLFDNYGGTSVSLSGGNNTTYYWYVVPRNAAGAATGCASSVTSFTTGAPPPAPGCAATMTPANGATNVTSPYPTFSWNAVTNSTSYIFYFGTSSNPDSIGVTSSNSVQLASPLQYSTTYYWRIVPQNAQGRAAGCQVFSFTTQAAPPPPACAQMVAPANNATNVAAPSVTFTWRSVPSATGYMFLLGANSSSLDTIDVYSDTTVALSPFGFNTTYYWSVVPINGLVFATGPCPVYSFTTQAPPPAPVNNECVGAIAISSYVPVNGSTVSATESSPAEQCGSFSTGSANDDVWYKFTALQGGTATITVGPTDWFFDPVIMVYSGNCGSLVNIGCVDNSLRGESESIGLTNLTAGATYYFRVYGYAQSGQLGEGNFTITSVGLALPVTIVDFKGERFEGKNVVSWTTATEQNNKGFELQRSADGRNFSAISFILTKANNGNSSSALQYSYADATPLSGDNYYRLKQLDKDEKATYSSVVLLKGAKPASVRVSTVYPNPTASSLKLVVTAPSNDKVNLIVTDLAGKVVMQQAAQLITGDNNLSLDVKKLASGSYIIKAVCASGCESATSKFMKQ